VALDVGAHHGVFSQALFDAGYTVHAFEPYPPSAEVLRRRFGGESRVTVHELALSDRNGRQPFHLVAVQGEEQPTQDSSYFHRLEVLELPAGLHMPNALEVETSRLDSLWEKGVLPERIGVLKVDAEGMDPRILASLPDNRIPVVLAEFHEQGHAFHPVDTSEQELMSMLSCMRDKGYFWHILFRYHAVPGAGDAYEVTAEFCQPACGDDSWGNVMFFSTYELYQIVREWCRAAGRPVYDSMDSGG
jgi:FkbM family methyltransferase